MVHLLLTPDVEPPGRTVPATYSFLRSAEGLPASMSRHGNYDGRPLLKAVGDALREGGGRLEVIEHEERVHQARRLRLHDLPDSILNLAEQVTTSADVLSAPWVRVHPTGYFSVNRRDVRRRRAEREADGNGLHEYSPETTRRLIGYLNNHSPNTFRALALAAVSTEARAFVQSMVGGRSQDAAHAALEEIALYPAPFYRAAPVTPRVHAVGISITSIPTPLRHLLTRLAGWVELDLTQSQMAVNARRWRVSEVQALLALDDFSFWNDLMVHLGADLSALSAEDYEAFKSILKEPVYGVVYGMGKRRIRHFGHTGDIPADVSAVVARVCGLRADRVGARITSHRVVKPMLAARRVLYEQIKANGGIKDAFGRFIPLKSNQNPGALLAVDAQAIELRLLESVIDAAIRERESGDRNFSIVVWQHDGFTISVRNHKRKALWVDRLQKLVAERARLVDIATTLIPKVGLRT